MLPAVVVSSLFKQRRKVRFTGTGRSQNNNYFALMDFCRNIPQNLQVTEAFAKLLDFDLYSFIV